MLLLRSAGIVDFADEHLPAILIHIWRDTSATLFPVLILDKIYQHFVV